MFIRRGYFDSMFNRERGDRHCGGIVEQVKQIGDVCDVDLEADLRGAVVIFDRLGGGLIGHPRRASRFGA
jgi:hypothetical protein